MIDEESLTNRKLELARVVSLWRARRNISEILREGWQLLRVPRLSVLPPFYDEKH